MKYFSTVTTSTVVYQLFFKYCWSKSYWARQFSARTFCFCTLQVSSNPICYKHIIFSNKETIISDSPCRCTSRLIRNRVIPTTSSVSTNMIIYHCLNGRPIAKLAPLYEVLSSITTASLIQTIHMIINLHVDCTHSITSHHSDVPRNWWLLCVLKRFF